METISFDEMSTLDVPSAALRSSLDKIASALQKVGAAGTDASAAVDELRTSLRAAAAQSVKSARSLAKFDEINRLSAPAAEKADAEKTTAAAKKTGGSTRKSGSRSGSRAKAEADGEVSIWQAALQTLRDAWDGFWLYLQTYYGPAIAAWQAAWEQIKQTALAVWEPVRAAALDLWNGALQPLADYLLTVFLPGVANSFSQAFAPILGGTISAAMTILGNLFVWLCGLIGELVNTVVQPALALLLEIWQGVMDGITAAWQAYGQPILDGLVLAFQGLTDLLTSLWQSVLQPVLTDLISLIGTLWSEHLQPLWQQLTMALGAVMNLVLTVWNTVLMPLAAWLVSTLGPVAAQVFNGIASVVGVAIGLVADAVNIGLTILQGLADFLTAVLQGRWSTAWNAMAATVTTVWSKITSTIQSAVSGILSVVRGMVSGIQSAVNGLLSSISSVRSAAGSAIGSVMGHSLPVGCPSWPGWKICRSRRWRRARSSRQIASFLRCWAIRVRAPMWRLRWPRSGRRWPKFWPAGMAQTTASPSTCTSVRSCWTALSPTASGAAACAAAGGEGYGHFDHRRRDAARPQRVQGAAERSGQQRHRPHRGRRDDAQPRAGGHCQDLCQLGGGLHRGLRADLTCGKTGKL